MKNINKLFIDDIRTPPKNDFYIIKRDFNESIKYMESFWCPEFISFDHDLWLEKNGDELNWYTIVKWIIEKDINEGWNFIPKNFNFKVHSMNPIGKKNIEDYFNNYFKFKNTNKKEKI